MADLTDVQDVLVALAAQTVYPNGTGQASITGNDIALYPGWPDPVTLDTDLKAGKVHVSVFARPEERNTTRYAQVWRDLNVPAPTITTTVNANQVTIGGALPNPYSVQNVCVRANGKAWVHAAQATDTLTSIATALAAQINNDLPGTSSSGAVLTLPASAYGISALVGGSGTSIMELGRQDRQFSMTVWAGTPDLRKQVAKALKAALAPVEFLTLADSSAARLIYATSIERDDLQKEGIYARDLRYSVEYADTVTRTDNTVVAEILNSLSLSVTSL